jgi:hypothetical protein
VSNAAYINLEIEALHPCTGGRAKCQVKPPRHGFPADELVSQERMDAEASP